MENNIKTTVTKQLNKVDPIELVETLDLLLIKRSNDPCIKKKLMLIELDVNIWGDLIGKTAD